MTTVRYECTKEDLSREARIGSELFYYNFRFTLNVQRDKKQAIIDEIKKYGKVSYHPAYDDHSSAGIHLQQMLLWLDVKEEEKSREFVDMLFSTGIEGILCISASNRLKPDNFSDEEDPFS